MSKEYFCRQIKGLDLCGETDPKKFAKGRYSSCKECRNEYGKNYNKKLREEERKEKEMDYIEKIDNDKGNLGQNIKNLVVETIHHYPLFEDGTILQRIEKKEINISEYIFKIQTKFEKYEKELKELKNINNEVIKQNELLLKENEHLRKEIINIKNILQNQKIFDFDDY